MAKDTEKLNDMAAEAVAEEAAAVEFEGEETEGQGETGQGAAGIPNDAMAAVFAQLFLAVGNVMCARAGVSKVSAEEAAAVGRAAADVAAHYDFEVSPLTGAWIGLGMAVAGVALPRMAEYEATIEAEATEGASEGDRAAA